MLTLPISNSTFVRNSGTVRTPECLREAFDEEIPFVTVDGCGSFSVEKTFDCGQAFRFDPVDDSCYVGVALDRHVAFRQNDDGSVTIYNSNVCDFDSVWRHYLSLDEDYDTIDDFIVNAMPCERDRAVMSAAVSAGRGIRILRQEPFETLISFIVSQNNNIPRIKKILRALCDTYGENGRFPTPAALVETGEEGLFALRTGFRAGYIYDAAYRVLHGELDLAELAARDDYASCDAALRTVRGIGPKVSACVLLYGLHKTEAFPIDVWIKRVLAARFPDGFDPSRLGRCAGIAQQYLFYYERYTQSHTK